MFEKRLYLERNKDDLRKRMLREPRGYPGLCCNLILPPTRPEADAGFVIMEQTDYPPMSGSNTICVTTVLLETGGQPRRLGSEQAKLLRHASPAIIGLPCCYGSCGTTATSRCRTESPRMIARFRSRTAGPGRYRCICCRGNLTSIAGRDAAPVQPVHPRRPWSSNCR